MFGSSSSSNSSAVGGMVSLNSSGWVVGGGNAKGGKSGLPWGLIVSVIITLYAIKKIRGAG